MASPSPAELRAFVRRHTRLLAVPDLPGIRIHQASDVSELYGLTALGVPDPGLPFWGFAWAGGLAVSRYLFEHPEEVAGRRVVDVASGSGLCGIVAMRLGAASAHALDVDPFAEAAVAVNARANGVHVGFSLGDATLAPPPDCDLILAGDICYEELMATDLVAWLRAAHRSGTRVLVGDPGRKYLPPGLGRLAGYQVRTTREIEDSEVKDAAVYTFGE
jgi:predicted nicotinamide N-methyase